MAGVKKGANRENLSRRRDESSGSPEASSERKSSGRGNTGGGRRGELTRPLEPKEKHLAEIQELAHLLDNSIRIPLINYRVGIDAIVGLVPVVGDFTAFGLAGWIIYRAARMGAPKGLLAKMLVNSLGDTLVGSIPGLGTLVDFTWKSNSRNLRMLERFLAQDR